MSQYLSGSYHCLTDKGRVREINEDAARGAINAYGNVFLVVADGMGGHLKGEYASNELVEHLIKSFRNIDEEFKNIKVATKWLNKVICEANEKIYQASQKNSQYQGMGTTLSACLIIKDQMIIAQIGDSRIYHLVDNKLEQITVDQTYVNYLINTKKLSPEEANAHPERHKLTNALGTKPTLNVDISTYPYNKEKLLLCSDGLYNNVPTKDILSILKGNDSLERKCLQLIAFGNANGGSDNMAVIIWEANN